MRAHPARRLCRAERKDVSTERLDEQHCAGGVLGLAPIAVQGLLDVLAQLRADGVSVLLVEQDVAVALAHADRAYVLETGRIVIVDTASALLEDACVRSAYLGVGA